MKRLSGKKKRRSASKQLATPDQLQSVTRVAGPAHEPPHTSHRRLGPWLALANLLPPPPSREEVERSPGLTGLLQIKQWEHECCAVAPAELVRRFQRSGLARVPAIGAVLDVRLLQRDSDEARRFHHLVGTIASALRAFVAAASPEVVQAAGDVPLLITRLSESPATSRSEIWMRNGAVSTRWVDPFKEFLTAIEGVAADRVRQCPVCGRFFFAVRRDQKTCAKRCNAVRRVREWRVQQGQHEYRRKLRRAGVKVQEMRRTDRRSG